MGASSHVRRRKADDPGDSPVVWFAVLEAARKRRDRAEVDRALDELRRLGYVIGRTGPRAICPEAAS